MVLINSLQRQGLKNANADALSRTPGDLQVSNDLASEEGLIAVTVPSEATSKSGERTLGQRQRDDPELCQIIQFLESGTLPPDEKKARELTLSQSQYLLKDEVLYYVGKEGSLRNIPPKSDRE